MEINFISIYFNSYDTRSQAGTFKNTSVSVRVPQLQVEITTSFNPLWRCSMDFYAADVGSLMMSHETDRADGRYHYNLHIARNT